MLSTEKWDNWGKDSLLVRFTALTCDEKLGKRLTTGSIYSLDVRRKIEFFRENLPVACA